MSKVNENLLVEELASIVLWTARRTSNKQYEKYAHEQLLDALQGRGVPDTVGIERIKELLEEELSK